MSAKLVFFDFPSLLPDRRGGSPFTWAVRLSLNYKGIPYKTEWATHDQIESICKENNIPPTDTLPNGEPLYTFPVIIDSTDPNNVVRLSDSRTIVEYLERTYPNPSLHPNDEGTADVEKHRGNVMRPLAFLAMKHLMSGGPPNVVAHFEKAAIERWGTTLQAAIDAPGPIGSEQREASWEAVRKEFEGFGLKDGNKWLDGGEEPKFKDFIVLGCLMLVYVSGGEGWPKIKSWSDGKWKRYWNAAEKYMAVD